MDTLSNNITHDITDNTSDDEEIKQIINREWSTGDGYFSPSAKIFSLGAKNYSCLLDQKLYYININEIRLWGIEHKLNPWFII